ncbi:MAG: hypothetical protein IKJ31_03195 [Bacteroidaceae bacterium]|nr:hypothetical protein [Bacteroidaceae bacterium]
MIDKIVKLLLAVCCICFFTIQSVAHPLSVAGGGSIVMQADTTQHDEEHFSAGNYGFNAMEFAAQGRFRHSDLIRYSNSGIFSHMSVGLTMSLDQIIHQNNYHFSLGTNYGLVLEKDVTKNHSLSLLLQYGEASLKDKDVKLERYSLQLNHHFNLSRYFLGYNPFRLFDFSTTFGVGAQQGDMFKRTEQAYYLLAGIRAKVRLSSQLSLSVEPHAAIATKGYNMSQKNDASRPYNAFYGVQASIQYLFANEPEARARDLKPVFPRHYLFAGGGLNFIESDLGVMDRLGPSINLGYGYWLAKRFAVQVSGGYASNIWKEKTTAAQPEMGHPEYVERTRTQYLFGRGELVYNLLSTVKDLDDFYNNHNFTMNVSAGFELGRQWKYFPETTEHTATAYGGFTGALNFKYHMPGGKTFFIEPRFSLIHFSVPYNPPYDYIKTDFTDRSYSITAGMEFSLPETAVRPFARSKEPFKTQYSFSAMAGSNYMMVRGGFEGKNNFNTALSLAAEYQPFSMFGLRLLYDYSTYDFNNICSYIEQIGDKAYTFDGLWNNNYNMHSIALNLKLDLTNMFYGYSSQRKWGSALYLGPIMTMNTSVDCSLDGGEQVLPGCIVLPPVEKSEDLHLGAMAALNTTYMFTPSLGIFGELGFKMYKDELLYNDNIDANPIKILTFQVGVKYRLK